MNSNYVGKSYISKKGESAMMAEIDRQTAIRTKDMERSIDILVLYVLAKDFGFGKKRCLRFMESFSKELDELSKQYEMGTKEQCFLAENRLREVYKIDIDRLFEVINTKM